MPRQLKRSRPSRFQLLGPVPGSDVDLPKGIESPGAVLSRALNEATNSEEPGVWEVVEWEDVVYRVHRLPAEKLDVRVEILR